MNTSLAWLEKLNEVDTNDTAAITQMTGEINQLRTDDEVKNFSTDQAIRNAGESRDGFFVVPKVIRK